MSIILFSRPIHSGKTTQLINWCSKQKNVHGILMPDINGSRKIMDIKTKEIFDIECVDVENSNERLTSIGKYNFYTAVFENANSIITDSLAQHPEWLIIDEAGKLELNGKGFYDSIIKATEVYKDNKLSGHLLIAVRDSFCEEIIRFFKLTNFTVIHQLEDLD